MFETPEAAARPFVRDRPSNEVCSGRVPMHDEYSSRVRWKLARLGDQQIANIVGKIRCKQGFIELDDRPIPGSHAQRLWSWGITSKSSGSMPPTNRFVVSTGVTVAFVAIRQSRCSSSSPTSIFPDQCCSTSQCRDCYCQRKSQRVHLDLLPTTQKFRGASPLRNRRTPCTGRHCGCGRLPSEVTSVKELPARQKGHACNSQDRHR